MDITYLIIGIMLLSALSNADSISQNVTRTYNFSPIPVSTKLIARTKVPLFMNSRGSYTVTKILEETNATSLESLHSSTPITLVTFPTFSKPINYSSHTRISRTKSNKASKSYKTPTIIIAASTTSKIASSQVSTLPPASTTKDTSITQKKNKLSMSKLAMMAATLSVDSTTKPTVTTSPTTPRKTIKPKPKRDKTKNPKNKLAKHQSTTPKTRKSKYNIKKKTIRKTKGGKNSRSKSNKGNKRKGKPIKNNTSINNHPRNYRQTNEDCHPYWNPNKCQGKTTNRTRNPAKIKIIKKRKVRRHTTTDFFSAAVNTMKNMYFKVFYA